MITLVDDPLATNVRADAAKILLYMIGAYSLQLDERGYIRLADRVWLHRTDQPDHGGTCFHFALDPFGEDSGSRILFCFLVYGGDVSEDLELLPTDQEDLFWWALWLADFRASLKGE